jgi:hypothetical protein
MTENGVRMMARVQKAVFITFVHGSISHPKWNRFGQFHAEHALWALTCFKFRILRGPQAAQRQRTAMSGGRFAGESFDATATAQRAECLLRSTTRCGRVSGAQAAFLAIGGIGLPPDPIAGATGQIWGLGGPFSGR